jgi:hypothetical protein
MHFCKIMLYYRRIKINKFKFTCEDLLCKLELLCKRKLHSITYSLPFCSCHLAHAASIKLEVVYAIIFFFYYVVDGI